MKNERIMSVLSLQSALHEASGIKVGGKISFDPNILLCKQESGAAVWSDNDPLHM